jgi:Trp operon repressor
MNLTKLIAWLTALLVFLVALGSFILSYNALYQVALSNGIQLAYIWPLLVDFPLVVFSLCAIVAYLHSESTWQLWSMVAGYVIATMLFNIIHAYPQLLLPLTTRIIVTCVPPLSLLLSFEVLMMQLKNSVTRNHKVQNLTQQVTTLQETIDDPITTRRQQVAGMLESHTQKAIAGELGVSISTVRSDIKALNNGKH